MSDKPLNYLAFETIFKGITHIFFREIKTTGAHLVPTSGPCIFIVSKHCNQFVDGVVFFSTNPRSSYAIMADVSYNKPLIGHVGKFLNASKFLPSFILYDVMNNIENSPKKFQ
jgi:1-acyl-sn-glycerol-3-phosphate acyltransferase